MLHDILECSWQSSVECGGVLARRPMKERAYPTSVCTPPTQTSYGSLPLFYFYRRINSDQYDIVFDDQADLRVCNRIRVERIPQSSRSCHRQGHRWLHLNEVQ